MPDRAVSLPLSETHLASSGPVLYWAPPTGFFKDLPSVDVLPGVHSHTPQAMCFGMTMQLVTHVPSSWFLTTSTVYSTRPFPGLLHPDTDHGVHRVSASDACAPAASPLVPPPFEALPSRAAVPVVSVRPLPPRRHRLLTGPTSRSCSTRESVAPRDCCQSRAPVAPLGFPPEASRSLSLLGPPCGDPSAGSRRSALARTVGQGHPNETPDNSVRLPRASPCPTCAVHALSRSPTRASRRSTPIRAASLAARSSRQAPRGCFSTLPEGSACGPDVFT